MLPQGFVKTRVRSKIPLVSVIIPTYNEEEDIAECLESLKKQTYPRIEVLVVDDGSTDLTREVVEKYKGVRLLQQNHQGPGEARNFGAREAQGELLVLIDADMILFEDYVEKLTLPLRENRPNIIGTIESVQYNVIKSTMQACWGNEVRLDELEGLYSPTVRGIARDDFLALGGFDKRYGYADDQTFFYKYDLRFYIIKGVKCYHKTPTTAWGVFKQSRWIGSSSMQGWLTLPFFNLLFVGMLYVFSPLAIILMSLRQTAKVKRLDLLLPWMFLFMTARYYGTLAGYLRKIWFRKNVR